MAGPAETGRPGALHGVVVLEATQYIAGPFAGQQLADYGADVVKIERPGGGDPFRNHVADPAFDGYGHNYRAYNRNKRSMVLDLQRPGGIAVFRRLAERADVVLENFRSGVLDRLGIGYEALRAINPRLVYCSIAGFANDGPDRNRPAFDAVGQALSGIQYLFTDPEKPVVRGPTIADQATGLFAAGAIFAALFERTRTGIGARIDVAMIDASIAFVPDSFAAYTEAGVDLDSEKRAAISHSFLMRCADGGLLSVHLGGPPWCWDAFRRAIGLSELGADPRFRERGARIANWAALMELLRPVFLQHSLAEWMARLNQHDLPAAEVLTIPQALAAPGVQHAQLFETAEHPLAGPVTMLRRAARIDGARNPPQRPPALLGEHTEEVLREAGYGPEEIATLRAGSIIDP